ncbi:uncharacterized protein LOC121276072 [Carcharodon carcharias]|uniref:uncharacterized protein LOC121276072 n=1 Tax=Carcharodon carcharias TaxID=13397 RepID=UPI001B7EDF61|nr:uncharacterized protein LOC121276072 [Carcharodon carcharias]
MRSIHARRREYINEKLQTIYNLLCGVVNMKCKDLNRLMPLPITYVEFLLKGPEGGENPFPLGLSQLLRINRQKMSKCYPLMLLTPNKLRTPELIWKTFLCNNDELQNSDGCRRSSQVLSSTVASLKSVLTETEAAVFELPPWLALIEAKNTTELRFRQNWRGQVGGPPAPIPRKEDLLPLLGGLEENQLVVLLGLDSRQLLAKL